MVASFAPRLPMSSIFMLYDTLSHQAQACPGSPRGRGCVTGRSENNRSPELNLYQATENPKSGPIRWRCSKAAG